MDIDSVLSSLADLKKELENALTEAGYQGNLGYSDADMRCSLEEWDDKINEEEETDNA